MSKPTLFRAGLVGVGLCLALPAMPAQAQCPYTSVQSRVQLNEQNPWSQSLSVSQGQSFRVGAFKNGWGVFVDCCTTISVTAPNGGVSYPANGTYVNASLAGTYTVRASCSGLSDTATVTVAGSTTYDMLDYMMHDNQRKANVLITNDNQAQIVRAYTVAPDRFYITKNYDYQTGRATDYEEYTYDTNWIYLVRDTSWQQSNWCNGQPTSFELWTGARNRGARFPRYVSNGLVRTANGSIIRARLEGGGCSICDSPSDSDGQNVSATYRFDKLASKTFSTGQTVYDLIKITVTGGPGSGEVYYYAKALGFVGYEDPYQWSRYSGPANNGNDFEVLAQDACPGQTGCTWLAAKTGLSHAIGRADGYDWSAQVPLDPAGYLSYGPYQSQWGVGAHSTHFYLWIDNNTANNDVVATIDVVTDYGNRVLARRDIRRTEFSGAQQWQWFTLSFSYPSFEQLETRVYWRDRAYVKHGQQYICKQ